MPLCPNCGTDNQEGAQFCFQCSFSLTSNPPPESWRINDSSSNPSTSYPPQNPPGNYPLYGAMPSTPPMTYLQPQAAYKHPAFLAVLSLFFPGLGLLFVPDRAGLGIAMMALYILMWVVSVPLAAFYIGCCCMACIPIYNFGAAIYSYDKGAKLTNGEFKPIIFK